MPGGTALCPTGGPPPLSFQALHAQKLEHSLFMASTSMQNWEKGKGLPEDIIQAIRAGRPIPRDLAGDSTRGMGIGLSVCSSIIKAHEGFFEAENGAGGGATFRFGLPIFEKHTEENET